MSLAAGAAKHPPDADWAEQIDAVYGLEMSTSDIGDLQPPTQIPEELEVFGTATIDAGDGFVTIQLAFDGDMFVLLDANGDEVASVQ